jgi:hypothetical protein
MNPFMLSTGSCRANAHNAGLSQQIGAFRVTRLTMILSAYPTPPAVNQARRSVRGGPHTGQMPLGEAETALSTCLNGRGSCEVPCHKTGVMPGAAAWTYHDLELNMNARKSITSRTWLKNNTLQVRSVMPITTKIRGEQASEKGSASNTQNPLILQAEHRADTLTEKAYFSGRSSL